VALENFDLVETPVTIGAGAACLGPARTV